MGNFEKPKKTQQNPTPLLPQATRIIVTTVVSSKDYFPAT
jgi:hypothetical protein